MFGDDEEFIPGPSSNLASLFDKRSDDGNLSLIYTAPKQPKVPTRSNKPSTASGNLVDLILYKPVEAYKLENGTYQNYGKTGVAVLGNEETRLYQILLYRDKLNHLCTAKINVQFKFLIQANNYATFYDKHNNVWSVLFASNEDAIEFSIQVALAKYNSEAKGNLMSQDLWIPLDNDKGTAASVGDTVEFHYTLHEKEQVNKLRQIHIGGKVCSKVDSSGWEQELQNIYKGTQRLIIIPAENLGDWKSVAPTTSSVLIVKLTVTQVINALTEVTQLPEIKDKSLKAMQLEHPEVSNGEVTVKARGATIKDALSSSPRAAKANLISRMARMGQATLPLTGPTATPSDSDEIDEDQSVSFTKQSDTRPDLKPRIRNNQSLVQSMPPTTALRNTPQSTWQPLMMSHMYPQMIASPSDSSLPVFFSEVRTHNSEIRMGITRVSDKVDNILSRLDIRTDRTGNDATLVSCIDRLAQENSSLKLRLEENCQQLQEQNNKILNILSRFNPSEPPKIVPTMILVNEEKEEEKTIELTRVLYESQESLSKLRSQFSEQLKHNEELKFQLKAKEDELEKATALNEEHNKGLIGDGDKVLTLNENHAKQIAELNDCLRKAESEALMLKENHDKQIADMNDCQRKAEFEALKLKEEIVKINLDLLNQKEITNILKEEKNSAKLELEKQLLQKSFEINELKNSLQKQEAVIKELKTHLMQEKDRDNSSEEIKTVMNIVYRYLKAQFLPSEMYDAASIQNVLVETIKTVTYQYLQSDSILRGDPTKLQKKTSVESNSRSSETKIVNPEEQNVEDKPEVYVQSEPPAQIQLDNTDNLSDTKLPGEYKTKEERDQMKFPLEPVKSSTNTEKKVIPFVEHNVPPMPLDPTAPTETGETSDKGDFDKSSKTIYAPTVSDLKVSSAAQGADDTVTYQYLQSDSILRGDPTKLQKKTSVESNSRSSETKIVNPEEQNVEDKPEVYVQSEPPAQIQLDNTDNLSDTKLPGEYKTKEERDQMKFPLEPVKSSTNTEKKVIPFVEHNVPPMPLDPTAPTETGETSDKGDFDKSSKKIYAPTVSDLKVSSAAQGADDIWRPQPPPPPLFDEDDNEDDWFNN